MNTGRIPSGGWVLRTGPDPMTLSVASGAAGDGGTGGPAERVGIGEITAADPVDGFGAVGGRPW